MGLKKYVVFSVIFIIAIYGYVFSLELGNYEVKVYDFALTLPISVWLIAPVAVLFLATLTHLLFYGLLGSLDRRAVNKDHETMLELIKANLLGKANSKRFKSKSFVNLSSILNQLNLSPKESEFTSDDNELNKIVTSIKEINDGKYVNDKSLKLDQLSKLANQNLLNKVNEQVDFAVDVLKKSENYSSNVVREAFINVVEKKSMTTIKKLYKNIKLDKELAKLLFEKDAANNEFGFTNDELLKIVKDLEYTNEDYMNLAKIYESILKPDQIIALFEVLSSEVDEATEAYLHVLFEYEMIDKVREVIETSEEDSEFTAFKALLDLKDAGKHYNLESISYK